MKPLSDKPFGSVHSIDFPSPDGEGFVVKNLLQLVSDKDRQLNEKISIIEQKSIVIAQQKKRIALLEEYMRLHKVRLYGCSSEKDKSQGELFDEAELEEAVAEAPIKESVKRTPQQGRKPLSPSLPRHQVYLDLSEEEKAGAIDTFYTKVKEELDIVPAKVRVLEYMQEKAVFMPEVADEAMARKIKVAPLPAHPIPKSVASISMLAYLIVSKYCDALPLYRLENILHRYGGSVTRTTMANWLIRLSHQLQPLINLMRDEQCLGDIIQADETRVQVLKEPGKAIASDKYMWVTLGGPPDKCSVLFEYDPSRSREVPLRLLEGFGGYLQTDGYSGYNAVCQQQNLTQLGCWDHARRKFVEAKKAAPKAKKHKSPVVSKADVALGKIRKLYAIEADIESLSVDKKYLERQKRSKPLLADIKQWLDKNITRLEKGSLTYKAMSYTLNQWKKLTVYCEDGRLDISNAAAENAIRPFAVGRKNWLFADTPKGAHASAIYYSLIESAKLNRLEPFAYIQQVLQKLPLADTVEKLEQLLPWAMKPDAGTVLKNS